LQAVTSETLAGRGGDLKEYVLGAEVLGRGPDFDPKADPIVRMQMGRLRAKLERYSARRYAALFAGREVGCL
jgi:hypothetical protein